MRGFTLVAMMLIGAAATQAVGGSAPPAPEYTSDFGIERCDLFFPGGDRDLSSNLVSPGEGNPYFPLRPGQFSRLAGIDENGDYVVLETTVLDRVRAVPLDIHEEQRIAIARVVEEREWIAGELTEIALLFYATCRRSSNVFMLGADVDHYEQGKIVDHDGSWIAGQEGARPGLVMPGLFLVGSRYYIELAPGVAMDRGEHVAAGLEVSTSAGVFTDGVKVLETSSLDEEEDEETIKVYARGVGPVVDSFLRLVEFRE